MVIFHSYVNVYQRVFSGFFRPRIWEMKKKITNPWPDTGWRKIHDLIAEIWGHWDGHGRYSPPSFWFPAKTLSAVPWPAGFLVLPAFRFDRRPHKNPQLRQVSKVGYQIPMFISKIKNVWYSDDILMIWWLLNRCPILEILCLHQIHQNGDHYFLQSSNKYNSNNSN